jgi:chromosome segregation ATPase
MADTVDYDKAYKDSMRQLDDWKKEVARISKEIADLQGQIDKLEALKKQRDSLTKDADAANKALADSLKSIKIPPTADPKQMLKLPDVIEKYVDKNGLKLGDYGSIKPNVGFDVKKMKLDKVELTWTWKFP